MIRLTRRGDDPEAVGAEVARALLEGGGAAIEGFGGLLDAPDAVTVYLVGAGPGDPGLLTRRGAALLARADVVLHDRLVSPAVLDLVPPSARLIDVGKDPDAPARTAGGRQEEIARLLVEHGRASAVVVRLKGGDPFLFGRGGEEVEVLARAGIAWEVVPGVTSAFGVPAAVGIPVTQRGLAASVTVVTGRVGEPGRDPATPTGRPWPGRRDAGDPHGHDEPGRHRRRAGRGRAGARHAGGGDRPGDDGVRSGWRARRWPAWPTSTSARPPSSSSGRWPPSAATTGADGTRRSAGRSHRGGDALAANAPRAWSTRSSGRAPRRSSCP